MSGLQTYETVNWFLLATECRQREIGGSQLTVADIPDLKYYPYKFDAVLIRRPGAIHYAIRYSIDRRAECGGQIDSVVEIPAVSVDTPAERPVHLIRRDKALAKRPNERTGSLRGGESETSRPRVAARTTSPDGS
jgi:hypothetical protein